MQRLRTALSIVAVVLFALWVLAGLSPFIRALVDLVRSTWPWPAIISTVFALAACTSPTTTTWPDAVLGSVAIVAGAFLVWRFMRGSWGHEP